MASALWKLYVYSATTDVASTSYDTCNAASVAALAGYTTTSVYILKPQATWEIETAMLEDISGARKGATSRRRVWEVETFPFNYANSGDQDLDDIDTLAAVIDSGSHLWVRVEGGSRTWPSTASTVHPVILTDWAENINANMGWRQVTLSLAHRFKA